MSKSSYLLGFPLLAGLIFPPELSKEQRKVFFLCFHWSNLIEYGALERNQKYLDSILTQSVTKNLVRACQTPSTESQPASDSLVKTFSPKTEKCYFKGPGTNQHQQDRPLLITGAWVARADLALNAGKKKTRGEPCLHCCCLCFIVDIERVPHRPARISQEISPLTVSQPRSSPTATAKHTTCAVNAHANLIITTAAASLARVVKLTRTDIRSHIVHDTIACGKYGYSQC